MKIKQLILIAISSSLLAACGGGSDSSTPSYRVKEIVTRNANGDVTQVRTFTYNATGQLLTILRDNTNPNADDPVTSYSYGTGEDPVSYSYDGDGDGNGDSLITFTYGQGGRLDKQETDSGINQTIDTTINYTYNANGKLTVQTQSGDFGVYTRSYNYDANGVIKTFVTTDPEGNVSTETHINSFDANGRSVTRQIDQDSDGNIDRVLSFTYEEAPCIKRKPEDLRGHHCIK